jgi:hypothetical protein
VKHRSWRLLAVPVALVVVMATAAYAAPRYVSSGPIRDANIALRYPSKWEDVTKKVQAGKDDEARLTRFYAGRAGSDVTSLVWVEVRPVPMSYADLDDFRTKYASLYFALPGDDPADYERYSDHVETTQRIGKRTGYRVDASMRIDFEDGTSAHMRFAELWIPRSSTSAVFVRVQASDDADGRKVIDQVMQSIRPA